MTMGFWKCDACGYSTRIFISAFIEKCPKCGAEYELLAMVYNYHIAHPIPFYILKGKPVSTAHMHGIIAFATSGRIPIFKCYNREYYKYIIKKHGDRIIAKMAEDFNEEEFF
ncbi:MAG: hypothetical protein ACTSRZ_08700 [Promethearchaeota archaeon]